MRFSHLLCHCLIAVLVSWPSCAAPPPDATEEKVIEVPLGPASWQIRYAFKDADGTLCGTQGFDANGSLSFHAVKCKLGKDTLTLSEGFSVRRGSNEVLNTEQSTRAVLQSNGNFVIVGGRAQIRLTKP